MPMNMSCIYSSEKASESIAGIAVELKKEQRANKVKSALVEHERFFS